MRGFDVHGVHGPDTCGMLQYMKGGIEPDKNLSADCTQCCQGLEVYETCGDTGDSGETDAPQPEVVVEWLSQTLNLNNVSDTRGIVIMSHHQPYSDFERAYLGTALQLQKILPKNRTVLWLFGHEHRFALYDKLRLNDTWNCTGSVSHFVSDFYFYPRMVGYGGYRDSPKAPKSKDRPWKLKAWDQRVYQEIPNDDDKNLQALGYNGYFKIVARIGRNDQKICDRSP